MTDTPLHQPTVLLAGCGYAAIEVLRILRGNARVIAVNPYPYQVNSGMTTRLLSGRFSPDLVRIPLLPHIEANGATFVQGKVTQIWPQEQRIRVETQGARHDLPYDVLLLNVGRQVAQPQGIGLEHAFTVRPMEQLVEAHHHVKACWQRAQSGDPTPGLLTFVVAGGGCTGVELMGELADLCRALSRRTGIPMSQVRWILVSRGQELTAGISSRFSQWVTESLQQQGIELWMQAQVTQIAPDHLCIKTAEGKLHTIPCLTTLWAGGLAAPPFLRESGLPIADDGSVCVEPTLQVRGFPSVFAQGDCAHFPVAEPVLHCPANPGALPKLGVFSVRAAPVMARNILNRLEGRPLDPFRPQSTAFISVTVGNGQAVMQKGPLVARHALAVTLKNTFDWFYMGRFQSVNGSDFLNSKIPV